MSTAVSALRRALVPDQLRTNVILAPYTTFRIGGPADLFYEATSRDDVARAVVEGYRLELPVFILGLGANILIGDRGVRGLVIRNVARDIDFVSPDHIRSDSGVLVSTLIRETVNRGLSGLEHYVGIPSTVGGAVWQNLHFLAPAPARERTMFIAEVVESVEVVTPAGVRRDIARADMAFGYDTSRLHGSNEVALGVSFVLQPGTRELLHRVMQENLAWRGARHPWLEHYPSAGSIFKKITEVGAGRLVDQCGLKGHRIGDAQISPLHANIIVNLGAATAADVRALIRHAQTVVLERTGHALEVEISLVGDF